MSSTIVGDIPIKIGTKINEICPKIAKLLSYVTKKILEDHQNVDEILKILKT